MYGAVRHWSADPKFTDEAAWLSESIGKGRGTGKLSRLRNRGLYSPPHIPYGLQWTPVDSLCQILPDLPLSPVESSGVQWSPVQSTGVNWTLPIYGNSLPIYGNSLHQISWEFPKKEIDGALS